ncbi:MAG: hypothetical protein HC839_02245 [Leptolyngbyaceae cyanobacterium RM2_2_21]|nr:hypothetical protein [Leptolyngbyaceae cyanobacterium RM2_2_21]
MKKHGIYIVGRVDKSAYPRLARGIEEGYIVGSSMGTSVAYSCCSICHNKSHTQDQYCDHILHKKNRKLSGKFKNAFWDGKDISKNDKDPIIGMNYYEAKEAGLLEFEYDQKTGF